MKQTFGLTLALIGWIAWASLAAREQGIEAQAPSFVASHYSSGTAAKHVTISTRTGQILSVLDVPAEVALSIHLISGEFTQPDAKTGAVTFSGDVSIRTRPRRDLVAGSARDQMMNAPLRLDVHDALVALTQSR